MGKGECNVKNFRGGFLTNKSQKNSISTLEFTVEFVRFRSLVFGWLRMAFFCKWAYPMQNRFGCKSLFRKRIGAVETVTKIVFIETIMHDIKKEIPHLRDFLNRRTGGECVPNQIRFPGFLVTCSDIVFWSRIPIGSHKKKNTTYSKSMTAYQCRKPNSVRRAINYGTASSGCVFRVFGN